MGVLVAIAEFVVHRIDHLPAPLRNHLHMNVRRCWKAGMTQHPLSVLDPTFNLTQRGHGSPDYLKRQFR
jgi:hypothetical protein